MAKFDIFKRRMEFMLRQNCVNADGELDTRRYMRLYHDLLPILKMTYREGIEDGKAEAQKGATLEDFGWQPSGLACSREVKEFRFKEDGDWQRNLVIREKNGRLEWYVMSLLNTDPENASGEEFYAMDSKETEAIIRLVKELERRENH